MTHLRTSRVALSPRVSRQQGFTLIEVLIAIVLLTVGLVSMLSVLCVSLASAQTSNLDLVAKQLANETYESVINARDTGQLVWDSIYNDSTSGGIFLSTAQPIYNAGVDGIYGTADDSAAGAKVLSIPNPAGTGYTNQALTNFTRTITVSDSLDSGGSAIADLKNMSVTISYKTPQGLARTYVLSSFISRYQ